MEFIDNTGHIFSLPSFDEYPFGYEYEENAYTFWFDDIYTSTLSINNYYIKKINLLIPCWVDDEIWETETLSYDSIDGNTYDICNIDIKIDSHVFNFVDLNKIQQQINSNDVVTMPEINENDFTTTLNNDNLQIVKIVENEQKFLLVPFYVIAKSEEEGTWSTNILIHVYCNEYESFVENKWCSITVGGIFQDEHEQLTINGQNMGIELPMDLFRAIYQKSFYDETFDEQLYNEKMREYLLNYMGIRGEVGNFNSAIQSLKWFGYGDNVTLTKLFETDNQFKHQYLIDFFDLNNDFLESYRTFRNSTFVRLHMLSNIETGEYNEQDFDNAFWGENNPKLEDLMTKMVPVEEGVNETFNYYKPYYDYTFNELLLKLACLKYYYEKYFLPIHLQIHSASLTHKVYANDVKFLNKTSISMVENIVMIPDKDFDVELPKTNVQYLTHQIHYVDDTFNEFNDINDELTLYKINDTCINIPIKFTNKNKYYDCVLLLEKLDKNKHYTYQINIHDKLYFDDVITIYDTKTSTLANDFIEISVSENGKDYSFYVSYTKFSEMIKQRYAQKFELHDNQFTRNNDTYTITLNDVDYIINEDEQYIKNDDTIIILPSSNDIETNLFNENASIIVYEIPKLYYRIKYNSTSLYKLLVNDINYTDKTTINVQPTSTLIYESHFTFNQNEDNEASIYRDFVIYPKMICDVNVNKLFNKLGKQYASQAIEYFIGETFRLRLLVNGKWYTYEFTIRIPDFNIHFGTLKYKYWNDDMRLQSNFTQLNYLGDENNKIVKFNSFMYEPRLVEVNHINFFKDFINYVNLTNIKYINDDDIDLNTFCYYIDMSQYDVFDTQHIYLTNDMYGNTLYIPSSFFTAHNLYVLFYQNTIVLLRETGEENILIVSQYNYDMLVLEGDSAPDYVKFIYDENTNTYHVEGVDDYNFNIFETLYVTEDSFYNKYIEQHHIPLNDAHLNQVHLFDLYRRERTIDGNYLIMQNNIDIRCKNLRFIHKGYGDNLYIQGKACLNGENMNAGIVRPEDVSNNLDIRSQYFNTRDDMTLYSVYWNGGIVFDEEKSNEASGYSYYEICDINGMLTGVYTNEPVSHYDIYDTECEAIFDKDTNAIGTIRYKSLSQLEKHIKNNLSSEDIDNYDAIPDYTTIETIKQQLLENDDLIYDEEINQQLYDIFINEFEHRKHLLGNIFDEYKLQIDYNKQEDKLFIYGTDTQIKFKVKYQRYDFDTKLYVDYVPLSYEYIEFASKIFDNPTNEYRVLVTFYPVKTKSVQNIEHEYTDEISTHCEYDEFGNVIEGSIFYTGVVNTQVVRLSLYKTLKYNDTKLINYEDVTLQDNINGLGIEVMNHQYGEHIYDIDSVEFINQENDTINQYWVDYSTNPGLGNENYINENGKLRHIFDEDLYYNNYLVKRLTGIKGHYMIQCNAKIQYYMYDESQDKYIKDGDELTWDGFKVVVCSVDANNKLNKVVSENGEIIEFIGNEKDVCLFFMIESYPELDGERYFTATVEPQLIKINETYSLMKYDANTLATNDDEKFSVRINGKTYQYEQNTSPHIWELYNDFFENTTLSDDIQKISQRINIDNWFDYDFYLMHDYEYWYVVFISKFTCDYARTIDDLLIDDENKTIMHINTSETDIPEYLEYQQQYYVDGEQNDWYYDWNCLQHKDKTENNDYKYKLVYNKSCKKFLPNRYYFMSSEGINHFTKNDLIVGTLSNNERLPININISTKWHITPLSINMDSDSVTCESNAEMVIFDTPKNSTQYERGYYNVDMRYSIDTYTTQQFKQTGKFRID